MKPLRPSVTKELQLQFLLPCWHDCREKLARRKRAAHYRKVGASAELATAASSASLDVHGSVRRSPSIGVAG